MINWSDIDTVLLDLDGTLLDLNFDNQFWLALVPMEYSKKHNIPIEKAKDIVYEQMNSIRGTLNWYCVDFWSDELDLNIIYLKKKLYHLIKVRPEADNFLIFLNKIDKNPVLVTNAHPKSIELKMAKTKISNKFKNIVSSHQIGKPKETAGFWPALNAVEQFDKRRTLFIDDSKEVLRTARKYGIKHLMTILTPDLTRQKIDPEEFYGIEHFSDISDSDLTLI